MKPRYDEKEIAEYFYTKLEDFDGTVEQWKERFYDLWRWQMSYNFAYKINLIDHLQYGGVELQIWCKKQYSKSVREIMEDYGYKIYQTAKNIGVLYYDDDLEDIDLVYMD